MPLDNHLFGNLQEGAAKNVALTYYIKEGGPNACLEYSFAMLRKVYSSLQRTIQAGCPSKMWIKEDINRVFLETLQRILDAKGTYIEDNSRKSVRHGVCKEARLAAKKQETLPVDNAMLDLFTEMIKKMKDSGGVTIDFDSPNMNKETFTNTLQTRGNEASDEDEWEDEEGDDVEGE
jgi:hypothetical protein